MLWRRLLSLPVMPRGLKEKDLASASDSSAAVAETVDGFV